jgi:hypothetical protein
MKKTTRRVKVSKPQKKLTTFRLDPELVRAARHYALDHDTTVTRIIEDALRRVTGLKKEGG